jgi:hypothetical protein
VLENRNRAPNWSGAEPPPAPLYFRHTATHHAGIVSLSDRGLGTSHRGTRLAARSLGVVPETANLRMARLRKMVGKNIGLLHYGLELRDDPASMLHCAVGAARPGLDERAVLTGQAGVSANQSAVMSPPCTLCKTVTQP